MTSNNTALAETRRPGLAGLIRLLRLPFDVLFLSWDFLRLALWVARNLPALLLRGKPRPFGALFAGGVIETAPEGNLWYCSLASKYGTKSILRFLFRGLKWHRTADGRLYLCWRGSRSEPPTSLGRFLLTGFLLACLWLVPAGGLLWHYRECLPLPGALARHRAGSGAPAEGPLLRRDPGQAARFLAQGADHEAAGRTAEARTAFRYAAAQDPSLIEAHLGLGRACQELGLSDDARQAFTQALDLAPADPRAALGLARALRAQGADRKAIEVLRTLSGRAPDCAEAYALESACQLALGEPEAASAAVEKALALAPGDASILASAAETEMRRGRVEAAERHYRALVDRDVKDARGRVGLGRISRLKGNLPEAEALLQALLAERPAEQAAIEELVDVQTAAGRPLQALATCRDSMAKFPDYLRLREKHLGILSGLGRDNDLYVAATKLLEDNAGNLAAHLQLAAMFLRRGLPTLAIDHCNKALAQQPNSEGAYRLHTSALLMAGDLELARRRLEPLLAAFPHDLDAILKLAEYHRRKGDTASAVALLRRGVEFHPALPIVHAQLAQMLFLSGDTTGALAEFREAQRLAPDDPKALNNTAAAIVHTAGDLDEALSYAERARALEPGNPQILDTLAWVHARRNTPDKALPLSELALALQPEAPILRYHQGAILAALGRNADAKVALKAALAPGVDFQGSADARALLDRLAGEPEAQNVHGLTP